MKAGWQTEKLGEVCALLNRGISPKYIETSGICVLNQKCIRDHRVSYEQARRHDLAIKSVSENRFIQLGDVLVNSTGTGTLGRVAQVREAPEELTTVDSHVTIVRPKQGKFYQDFFGYMLILIEEAIKEAGEGCGGQTELARSVLAEKFLVSYPTSISEQQCIVAILDQAFECIAKARANSEQSLQNTRALFESHLQSVFTQRGEGWLEGKLEDIVDEKCTLSYGIVQPGDEFENGLPIIRPTNLTSKYINLNGLKRINPELANSYKRTTLLGDELLLCVRGSTGIISLATEELKGANVTRGIVPVRFRHNLITPVFGYFMLISAYVQEQIRSKTYGTALMQINIGDLRKIKVTYPLINQQNELSFTLTKLDEETQRLETIYQRKITLLDELKKSLLQQAFAGEL